MRLQRCYHIGSGSQILTSDAKCQAQNTIQLQEKLGKLKGELREADDALVKALAGIALVMAIFEKLLRTTSPEPSLAASRRRRRSSSDIEAQNHVAKLGYPSPKVVMIVLLTKKPQLMS